MGYRSLSLPVSMPMYSYNSPRYEPLWAAVEELGIPLAFHVFTSGPSPTPAPEPEERIPNDLEGQVLGMSLAMYPMVQLTSGRERCNAIRISSLCWWSPGSDGSRGC